MMVEALQELSNSGKLYTLREIKKIRVSNGIYILFEEGENSLNGKSRVVRIGINSTNGRFKPRLGDHFLGEHRSSVFRKHIGRALLMKLGKRDYMPLWDLSNKQVPLHRNRIDAKFETGVEDLVSSHIDNKFKFSVVQVADDIKRKELERKLISTLAFDKTNCPSKNWLGHFHPDKKISDSGLWNIHYLNGAYKLTANDLAFLNTKLIR